MITQTIKDYKNRGRVCELSNGIIDIAVMIDHGPRIIRFGFCGKENMLCDDAPLTAPVEGFDEPWVLYGGHRFWASPERFPKDYYPDNGPVKYEWIENGVRVIKAARPREHVEYILDITINETDAKANILHTLVNKGEWTFEAACWGITDMSPGGLLVIPFGHEENLKDFYGGNNRRIIFWSYGTPKDERVYWGDEFVTINHNPELHKDNKFAFTDKKGWAAYYNHDELFIKRFGFDAEAEYPEGGGNLSCFTTYFMQEIETLSPLSNVKPEKSISHTEVWELYADVARPSAENEDELFASTEKFN